MTREVDERVRIRVMQQTLNTRQNRCHIVRRTPTVLQDIETELAVGVNVRVEHLAEELYDRGFVRVGFVEGEDQAEGTVLEWGVGCRRRGQAVMRRRQAREDKKERKEEQRDEKRQLPGRVPKLSPLLRRANAISALSLPSLQPLSNQTPGSPTASSSNAPPLLPSHPYRTRAGRTGSKDDRIPHHDVVGLRSAADPAWRIRREALEITDCEEEGADMRGEVSG